MSIDVSHSPVVVVVSFKKLAFSLLSFEKEAAIEAENSNINNRRRSFIYEALRMAGRINNDNGFFFHLPVRPIPIIAEIDFHFLHRQLSSSLWLPAKRLGRECGLRQ